VALECVPKFVPQGAAGGGPIAGWGWAGVDDGGYVCECEGQEEGDNVCGWFGDNTFIYPSLFLFMFLTRRPSDGAAACEQM